MARRVNTKFLIILVTVCLGLLLGVVAGKKFVQKYLTRGDSSKLLAEGDKLYDAGEYDKAKEKYQQAAGADPGSTEALIKLGDACAKLTPEDPMYLEQAHGHWNRAVSLDPKCAPALERLLDSYWDVVDFTSQDAQRAALFTKSSELAEKLSAADPGNKKAAARRHIALVRKYLVTQAGTFQDVEGSVKALKALTAKDPGDAEVLKWYTQARIRDAQQKLAGGSRDPAVVTLTEVEEAFDKARKDQPNNGSLQFRAFQTYNQLDETDPRTKDKAADPRSAAYKKKASESIDAALAVATEQDPLYVDIQLTGAHWYNQQNNTDRGKAIIQAFYDKRPADQRARLAMAKVYASDNKTRAKAVEVLSQPMAEDKAATGFKALVRRELQAQTLHDLTILRLGDYATAVNDKDAAKQQELQTAITDGLDKLRRLSSPRAVKVLGLEGRLHLVKGENVDAVKSLEDAVSQMTTSAAVDYEIMYLLAQAYVTTRQPGQSKGLLEKIVAGAPKWTAPRLMLTDMLLQNGDIDAARQHIAVLKTQVPDLEALKKLESVAAALGDRNIDIEKMPEKTREDKILKIKVASQNKPDVAIRLLKEIAKDDPKDIGPVRTLVELYMQRKQTDRALEIVDGALKDNSDDRWLKEMKVLLENQGGDPKEMYAKRMELATAEKDPYTREMRMYDVEMGPGGHPEQTVPHLLKAYEVKTAEGKPSPELNKVTDLLFDHAVARKDWGQAEAYLRKLVEANADECGGYLYRSRYAMARGDYPQAEQLAQYLRDNFSQFAQSYFSLAQAQHAQGKFLEAAQNYSEVRKRQERHYDALRGLVDCFYQGNKPEAAEATLEQGRRLFPKDVTIREMYLNHLVNYGDPQKAVPDREALLKEHPDEPGYNLALASTYFHAAQFLATKSDSKGMTERLNQAFNTLEQGKAKSPDDGRFYAQQAEMFQYAGRIAEGEKVLQAYSERPSVSDKPLAWILMADFYLRINLLPQAERALGTASTKADRDERLAILLRLAGVQTQEKKFDDALGTLASARADDDPRLVRQRLEILIAKGNADGSLEPARLEIVKAIQKKDSADLHNLLASVLIDTGKVAEAEVELAAAQKLDPRNEVTRYLQALAMAKRPKPEVEGAINVLLEVRTRNPRNVQVRLLLSDLYFNTGRRDAAIAELDEAVKKVPLSKEVRLNLVRMLRTVRKFEDAEAYCYQAQIDPVLRADPTWPREKAINYMVQKRIEEAIIEMGRAIDLDPTNVEYKREKLDMILQFKSYPTVLRESTKYMKEQKIDTWWIHHQRGLAIGKTKDLAPADLGLPPAFQVNRVAEALKEFDRALELADAGRDPNLTEFILRGMAGSLVDYVADPAAGPAALKTVPVGFNEAISRAKAREANDPENRWHLLEVSLYRGKGDFATATKLVEDMLPLPANQTKDRRSALLRAAADVYTATTGKDGQPAPDYQKAKKVYEELVKLTPDDLAALNNLAYLLSDNLNNNQEAKKYSRKAYDVSRFSGSPNDLIYDTHGWILTLCGGPDDGPEGLNILRDVVKRRPDLIEARYHLGRAYMKSGVSDRYPLAIAEFTLALDLLADQKKTADADHPIDQTLEKNIQAALAEARQKAAAPTPPAKSN